MYRIYQVMFLVGVIYTLTTFLLGNFLSSIDIDLDIDMDFGIFNVSPLKPIIIVSFLTTFGGMGMFGYHLNYSSIKTFLIALFTSLIISSILYFFVVVPLYNAQDRSLAVTKDSLIGKEAVVMNAILENGFGKISYIAKGNRFTGSAKTKDGKRIDQNKTVVIVDIKDHVFYVEENLFIQREKERSLWERIICQLRL